jgi:DNA-binding transcriptional MocR family regulator
VGSAYRILRSRGLIIAAGRRGTRVAPRPAALPRVDGAARRRASTDGLRDLTVGLADPALLPPLGPALAKLAVLPHDADDREEAHAELLRFAREWFDADGVRADHLTVVSGAMDAVERVLAAHLRTGDEVIVEDPGYPPIRDVLLALGLVELPVAVDERGLIPEALGAALARGPAALVLVPRAQNPTGAALDVERASALKTILAGHPELLVIEDDHVGLVSGADWHSTIASDRRHWAVARSLSKSLHPDLRLALLAGDETTISRVEGRQRLGPRYVSHLLQSTAATMLNDPGFTALATRARETYATRRRTLIDALAAHGIEATARAGLNVWIPVPEEAPVVRAMAAAGWLLTAGERFRAGSPPAVRVTISTLRDGEAAAIAAAIAEAVRTAGVGTGY